MDEERPAIEVAEGERIAATWTPEELNAINQVAAAVSQHLDLQPVLEVGLDAGLRALNLDLGWVRLFDEAGRLQVRVVRGLTAQRQESLALLESTSGVCGAALDKGQPVVIHGAPGDPEAIYPVLQRHGLHSYLGVPLMLGGKTKGVLVTASAAPFRFTPHQVQLIRLLAAQIAIAIEHALLYDELERERTAREGALREANEGLERLNQLKDDFLSVASHELKTPITSIKVFSELAGRRPEAVNPQIMRMLGRQADRLVAMINNLLDVSRLQLDRLTVDMQPVDLSALAHDYCERYAFLLEGHVVSCIARQAPLMVNADPMRLEEVFSNLLDNAVKYSAKGSRIRLEMGRTDATARLLVQDEGIGIPAEHLPHLFERFYKPSSQGYPGLGLGLYICKEIVERHGGRIWAESEGEGKGATFYVELPLAQEQ